MIIFLRYYFVFFMCSSGLLIYPMDQANRQANFTSTSSSSTSSSSSNSSNYQLASTPISTTPDGLRQRDRSMVPEAGNSIGRDINVGIGQYASNDGLWLAMIAGCPDIVRSLLRLRNSENTHYLIDPNQVDAQRGIRPLEYAINRRDINLVRALIVEREHAGTSNSAPGLNNLANVNLANQKNNLPIHIAIIRAHRARDAQVRKEYFEIIKLLYKAGASLSRAALFGMNAHQIAYSLDDIELIDFLDELDFFNSPNFKLMLVTCCILSACYII